MKLNLKIWRQKNREDQGRMVDYTLDNVNTHMSFLEMLDTLNDELIRKNEEPVEFDHDCREGICGQCGVVINGIAHGPLKNTTTCQLHMREFKDNETIFIEPFRASGFPIKKDLKVTKQEMPKQQAVEIGAEHQFIDRYPDVVTVYSIGDVSKEICTGPHVENLGVLGEFKIKKEESSSSGIRRIKAVLK